MQLAQKEKKETRVRTKRKNKKRNLIALESLLPFDDGAKKSEIQLQFIFLRHFPNEKKSLVDEFRQSRQTERANLG